MTEILSVWWILTVVAGCAQDYGPRRWQNEVEAGRLGEKVGEESVDKSNWAVKDAQAAVERAERVLGVARGTCPGTAQLVKLIDDNTPFLVTKLERKTFWQVTVNDWRLDSPPYGTEAQWSTELLNVEDRMVGERSDPCRFSECHYNEDWGQDLNGFTASDVEYVPKTPGVIEWGKRWIDAKTFEVWDNQTGNPCQ